MPGKKLYIFIFLFSFLGVFSQIEKGNLYFERGAYTKAIIAFKKVTKSTKASKKDVQEAFIKLGNSYKKMSEYTNAVESYSQALLIKTKNAASPELLNNYAQVLKACSKYPEAIEQYNNYVKINPNDARVNNDLKFCMDIKTYLTKPAEYRVKNLKAINSQYSESSPFYSDNHLFFTAARPTFNFYEFVVNPSDGQPFPHLYLSTVKGDKIKKEKELPKEINTDYFDGPACFTGDGKTMYFSRIMVSPKKGQLNTARIFSATRDGNGWKDISPVNVSSDDYSAMHPSISADNSILYFTSDMPGGFGGKDIYMSRKSGITWTKPVNLGPEINTSGEEMFPSIRKDGTLFFSSNGLAGFGGLDIFSASKNDNKWVVTRNEGLPLNSNMDDFGISFENDTSGYFTSNRDGGKGNDDIYAFKFVNKSTSYSGLLLLTKNINNPAKNTKILLKDDYGRLVDSVYSAENGAFTFNNLNTDVKYLMLLDEDDPSLAGKSRYYIATKDGVIMLVSGKNGIDRYVFKNLPMDVNTLPDLFADNDPTFNVTLAGNVLYDDKGTSKPVRNTHLKMVNDYGDIVESTMSNEFGAFVFRNVPGDQNYIISMDEKDVSLDLGTRVFLTNKDGKELQSFYFGKGKENFKILNADKTMMKDMKVDDAELLVAFNGFLYDSDKKPLPNAKVQMREEGSDRSFYATTDQNGNFKFKNLDADKNYIFESAEDDPALAGMKKIFLGDKNGKIYKVLNLNNGKFNYKIIEPDKYAMADFEVDDPWLQALDLKNSGKTSGAALTIVESILYASGDYKPDAPGQKILDKVSTVLASNTKLTIEIISHTDSKASDAFNLTLSKKRAQTAVDYIASKGIDIKRLKSIGLGESKLLNRCANGVTCSDDEHKINRRTEFKISESVKK